MRSAVASPGNAAFLLVRLQWDRKGKAEVKSLPWKS